MVIGHHATHMAVTVLEIVIEIVIWLMSRMRWPSRSGRDRMPCHTHGGDCVGNPNQNCEYWYTGNKDFPT